MCKKSICLISIVLVLALAGNAVAQIDPASIADGHVYLFEDVGADVPDDSANSLTANLIGSPQVVDGLKGKALQFNGTSDGIHIPDGAGINLSTHQNHTVVAIFNCADVTKSEKQTGAIIHRNGQKHFSLRRLVPTHGMPLLWSFETVARPRKTTSLKCGWTES